MFLNRKIPSIKNSNHIEKFLIIDSPYINSNIIVKKLAKPYRPSLQTYSLQKLPSDRLAPLAASSSLVIKEKTSKFEKKNQKEKNQQLQLRNSAKQLPKMRLKEVGGWLRRKRDEEDTYYYLVTPGNNHQAVLRSLELRSWLKPASCWQPINFYWRKPPNGINYNFFSKTSYLSRCYNKMEFSGCLTVKANLYQNFVTHCKVKFFFKTRNIIWILLSIFH